MASPAEPSTTSAVGMTGTREADALIFGERLGAGTGDRITVTYSFPWQGGGQAAFAGVAGQAYSPNDEPLAGYGLNDVQMQAARSAFQAWSSVANIEFVEVRDTADSVGDIRIAWTHDPDSADWGWAILPNRSWPAGSDIWINGANRQYEGPWHAGSYNVTALLHEIGHALGLKHSFEGEPTMPAAFDNRLYTVMSYADIERNPYAYPIDEAAGVWQSWNPSTPMLLDIAAIQHLYGANRTHHAGDDVYRFDAATPTFQVIWDAGGQDTISLDGFVLPSLIDLNEGSYSALGHQGYHGNGGPDVKSVGIAYGTVIENAVAGQGNDILIGNRVDNALTGGAGRDTAVFQGNAADYVIRSDMSSGQVSVLDSVAGRSGNDVLFEVERARFDDASFAFDIGQNAGQAYRLYRAAFDREPDRAGLGYWIDSLDDGVSLDIVAGRFIGSHEFAQRHGASLSEEDFVAALYENVLDRAPDDAGFAYWRDELQSGRRDQADVLVGFSESAENQQAVIDLIRNGIEYLEWTA